MLLEVSSVPKMMLSPPLFWLCFSLAWVSGYQRCVEIVDAGLLPVIKGHIGIHFFVTVINRGSDSVEVKVGMVQCCEDFPGGQTDCTNIHLIPETRMMESNSTRNFTLIHPTMYPYNRRGECLLGVHYMTTCNRSKEALQHIAFDTALSEQNVKSNVVRGFPAFVTDTQPCNSYDEDALNNCKMVDCHMKYFGMRSYFNKGSRTCQCVPPCLPTRRRSVPDIVYDVTNNQCTDLNSCLNQEDLQHLAHADLEPDCSPCFYGKMVFMDCHHGTLSNTSGDCVCDSGFKQAEMPNEPGYPRTQVFHSCNVDTSCWYLCRFLERPNADVLFITFVLAVLVAILSIYIIHQSPC